MKNYLKKNGIYKKIRKYCSSNNLCVWPVNPKAKSEYEIGITLGPDFSEIMKGEKEKKQEMNKIKTYSEKIKEIAETESKNKGLEAHIGGPSWAAGGALVLYLGFKQKPL